jgi:AcrR family transcriptional regulator
MATSNTPYHHGDLPAALLRAAMEILEESGATELSLRAVARHAGVSAAAPYRHYADRNALLSAIAAVGYRELATHLSDTSSSPSTVDDLAAIAVAYVQFALQRPGLFRVMFVEPCDPDSPERAAATAAITEYLKGIVRHAFPEADPEGTSTAVWALVHGLAFLHLDGKLDASSPDVVADRVRTSVRAVLTASNTTSLPALAAPSTAPRA